MKKVCLKIVCICKSAYLIHYSMRNPWTSPNHIEGSETWGKIRSFIQVIIFLSVCWSLLFFLFFVKSKTVRLSTFFFFSWALPLMNVVSKWMFFFPKKKEKKKILHTAYVPPFFWMGETFQNSNIKKQYGFFTKIFFLLMKFNNNFSTNHNPFQTL